MTRKQKAPPEDPRLAALRQDNEQLKRALADSSVACLNEMILDGNTPAASRVSAIRLSLDFACRGMELDNLLERIS